jgi:hypothetical protein
MIDLETMSNKPDAAIVSIGAVLLDPLGPEVMLDIEFKWDTPSEDGSTSQVVKGSPSFYRNVDLEASIGDVDCGTIKWWLQQSQEAQKALFTPEPVPLSEALSDLSKWYWDVVPDKEIRKETRWWSHGSSFDLVVLQSAFRGLNRQQLYNHYRMRDTRTLFDLLPTEVLTWMENNKNPGKHNALQDAVWQARLVQYCYKLLKKATP